MSKIKQLFQKNVRKAPTFIIVGGLSIALLSLVACVVTAQNRGPKKPEAKVQTVQPSKPIIIKAPVRVSKPKTDFTVTEIKHDGKVYLLVQKKDSIAIVRK